MRISNEQKTRRRLFRLVATSLVAAGLWCVQAVATAEESTLRTHTLEQIVVTGTKTPHSLKNAPVETVLLEQQDISKTNAQNIMDVLKNIPGISASAHDDSFGAYTWNAKMRGLSFNDGYALILIDGQRVMGPGQSGGMGEYGIGLNQIPVDMIERIEVVKGPGSALYGSDAIAGVINIITRKTPKQQTAGAGAAYGRYKIKERLRQGVIQKPWAENRYQSQSYLYVGDRLFEKAGYLLQYNYESAQDIGLTRIDSDRHSLMAKVEAEPTERLNLFSKLELSDYEKADSREEDSRRLSAGSQWQPGADHFISLNGYVYDWDFRHGFVDNSHGYKYGDIGYRQLEGQHTWRLDDMHTLTSGFELQRQGIDFTIENQDGSLVSVDKDVDVFSFYLQDEILALDGKFSLIPGIRYDKHDTFGDEFNPKFSAMYHVSEDTSLRISVGRAFKSPTIRQLYYDAPYKHGNYYNQSNPDLNPETAMAYSASLAQWLSDNRLMFSFGYFRSNIKEMVTVEDTGALYNGLPLQLYRNVEKAQIQGIEFLSKAWLGEYFSLNLSYTYTDSENKENGNHLTYTPEHQFSLSPAYDLKQYGVGLSASLSYYSQQYNNTANTSQIDAHTALDAKIYLRLNKAAKLSFEADNILNSDKGDELNFRIGRSFAVKLDSAF